MAHKQFAADVEATGKMISRDRHSARDPSLNANRPFSASRITLELDYQLQQGADLAVPLFFSST
jgi:hypothetical protein